MSSNKEQRKQQMMRALATPAIFNNSPDYSKIAQEQNMGNHQNQLNGIKLITVNLDQLKPFEGNPRKTKNPKYEEIKASIKSRGLDHAPNITQRPGDSFYTVLDGGNTRLQALNELFKETKDLKFWSIDCVFKPWQGDADDINSQLNVLIGHLAENDIRGDLTFIEKALGIKEVKALYEKKYNEFFSHRKLAEKLGENGYPISYSLIAKMEQCLTYLYPHIPNVLLSGLGKPQIEKLLAIRKNALTSWEHHQEEHETLSDFDQVWMDTLSPFDEDPTNFVLTDLQDSLIGNITEAFSYKVSYETFKFDIDLSERKLRKLMDKQSDIQEQSLESEHQHQEDIQQAKHISPSDNTHKPAEEENKSSENLENPILDSTLLADTEEISHNTDDKKISDATKYLAKLGLTPGVNPETTRQEEARINDLEFANTGRQPISTIWKIYPNRPHKTEAYSLAIDIADECGFAHLIEHVIHTPVDYSFKVNPIDTNYPILTQKIHQLLTALSTENLEQNSNIMFELPINDLLETISDLMLVRIFRLIRVIRYLKEHHGGNHA